MAYCSECNRHFADAQALKQHWQNSAAHDEMYACEICNKTFYAESSLEAHQRSLGHYSDNICEFCSKRFRSEVGLAAHQQAKGHEPNNVCHICGKLCHSESGKEMHLMAKHSVECTYCDEHFFSDSELLTHYATDHGYCVECSRAFKNSTALQNHIDNSSKHVDEFTCVDCDRSFVSGRALEDHLRDKVHSVTRSKHTLLVRENYCEECEWQFGDDRAYEQHRASLRHNPVSVVECPYKEECGKTFTAPSALVHHLESGGCGGGINRAVLDRKVLGNDTRGIITGNGLTQVAGSSCSDAESDDDTELECHSSSSSTSNLYAGSDTDSLAPSTPGGIILTPTSSTPSNTLSPLLQSLHLTPASSSTQSLTTRSQQLTLPLHCPLCPDRGAFVNTNALEQHLHSAAHAPKLYHCPTLLPRPSDGGHTKWFSTLSGLVQHVEARACNGGQNRMQVVLKEAMSILGFGRNGFGGGSRLLG